MANKYQMNQNSDNEKHKPDIFKNDSELTNNNSYMIYELNNTFNDKNKDVFNVSANVKHNNKKDKNENKKNAMILNKIRLIHGRIF